MDVDYLIVGLGLAGCWLSHELERVGQSCLVIDDNNPESSSRVASGIINPVTGRRIVKTWMIDTLLPFAQSAYTSIEKKFAISCFRATSVVDFFPTAQMRLAFVERYADDASYLKLPETEGSWQNLLQYDFGYGEIRPCYLIDVHAFLSACRDNLAKRKRLQNERFESSKLFVEPDGIRYMDITAKKILFCDGTEGADNPYFNMLPFAPNKGEVLIVEIPSFPSTQILKKGISVVPWKPGLFWVGSSHEWKFDHDKPTPEFMEKTIAQLKQFLKMPFHVMQHLASVRPATLERRPFIGLHPKYPAIGIFNGMGTKGCSLAPYFAQQFVSHLLHGTSLLPEVDILRFKNVLSRS